MLGQKKNLFTRNFDRGEELLLVLRRHWIVYVNVAVLALVLFLGTVFAFILQATFRDWLMPLAFQSLLIVTTWLFLLQILYIHWINNQLDVTIISNKRILDLEQTGFLSRAISETTLSRVQEVNAQKGGLFGNLLHFGDISIHTGADQSDFHIKWVHHPLTNARRIHSIVDTFRDVGKRMAAQGSEPNLGHGNFK